MYATLVALQDGSTEELVLTRPVALLILVVGFVSGIITIFFAIDFARNRRRQRGLNRILDAAANADEFATTEEEVANIRLKLEELEATENEVIARIDEIAEVSVRDRRKEELRSRIGPDLAELELLSGSLDEAIAGLNLSPDSERLARDVLTEHAERSSRVMLLLIAILVFVTWEALAPFSGFTLVVLLSWAVVYPFLISPYNGFEDVSGAPALNLFIAWLAILSTVIPLVWSHMWPKIRSSLERRVAQLPKVWRVNVIWLLPITLFALLVSFFDGRRLPPFDVLAAWYLAAPVVGTLVYRAARRALRHLRGIRA